MSNTAYAFRVRAYNAAGESEYSNTAILTTAQVTTVPAAPGNLAVTAVSGTGAVSLTWIDNSDNEAGFVIEQSTDGTNFTDVATTDPNATTSTVTDLLPNTAYTFRVRAYNAAGNSEYASTFQVTVAETATAPTAPSDLSASQVTGAAAISLTWTDNSDNEAGFIIQQSSNGSDFADIATTDPNCTTWTVGNLLSGKQYSFRVRATNHMGDSADSNTAAATTASVASAPYVKQAAAAADSLVTGTSTTLSVFGVNTASGADYDTDNDSNLTYTWAATMLPPGAADPDFTVSGSENGTNAAKNASVEFHAAGTYWLTVTIENTATNKSTTSSVAVTVAQTADDEGEITFAITPASASLHAGETLQFTATGADQFGNALDASALTWTTTAGDITPEGFFTAPEGSASVTVMVTSGSLSDSSTVTVTNAAPTIATAAAAVQVPATATAALSVLGADDADESKLTYTWTCLVKPAGADDPTISVEAGENGANAARNATAAFTSLGNYQFQVTITDGGGLSVTDSVAITVVQTLTSIELTPASPSVALGGTQQFTATGYDQFEDPMAEQPEFYFSATAGSIDADGLYTAPSAAVPATVSVSSGGVVARADVSLTDPSPTTSARFGNTWLADWWVEALGSPEARQERIEQASGSMEYTLSTGFIVDPTVTFTYSDAEKLPDPLPIDTTDVEYQWEVDGVVYTSVESTTYLRDIEKTLETDGTWTYSEVFTTTYTVITTMDGEDFATVTGSYGYDFSAYGGGDVSAYTFAAIVSAPVVGATEEGAAVGAWTQTVGATDSITHTRNHATGARSGRRFGNGGAGMTFPSYTQDGYLYADGGHSDFDYDVDYTYDEVSGWTFSGTATTTWADSGSTSDSYTDTYDDVGDGWSYKETSGMTSKDKWSYSYTLNHAIQSDGSWQATSGSGGSEGSGSWTWSYNGGGNYWPAAPDEELCGKFTDEGADTTTYEYETTATWSDGKWHETGTGQVSDSGHTHYTYEGEGSFSSDDGDGSQSEKGYERTEYSATVDYTFTEGHWNYASGTADYSEKWSDRWDYSVTDLSGDIETKGWDEAYEKYDEDYTLDTERGRWQMTDVGVRGNGKYGYRQTTTNPIPYTADGEHGGISWEVEGTHKSNQGGGVEYAYWGTGEKVFDLWFYDGQGSVTAYTTSGSSYSGQGEYGVGNDNVNGTVTAEDHKQSRFDSTKDYVLDTFFGTWEVDGYRCASSGDSSTKWSYSMFDSVYEASGSDWSVSGNKNKGETYHTASEYYRGYQRDPGQQNWSYDLDRSYSSSSIGMSKDASYSGSGTYTHTLAGDNSGRIDGTVDANGKSSYDTTYTERSTLNASGSWNTPTLSVTTTDTSEDNWSHEGKGKYERYKTTGRPSEVYGTITESGTDKRDIEFSVTSTRNSSGIWSVTDSTGKILTSSESTYGYSGSGTYTSSDEFWESTATTDESGSGKNLEQLVVRYEATGVNWKQTESTNSITADSKESLDYVNSGSGPGLVTLTDGTDAEVTRYSTREYHEGKESSDRTPTTGGAATQTITSHGTRTLDSYYEPYTIPPALEEMWYQQDEFGIGESGCVQVDGTCTNVVRGTASLNGWTLPQWEYGQSGGMSVSTPGYYYNPYGLGMFALEDTGRNTIGYAPISGYTGTQSHSFTTYTTPSMTVDYNGALGPLSDVMAAAPGGMALLSAPAATSPLAATGPVRRASRRHRHGRRLRPAQPGLRHVRRRRQGGKRGQRQRKQYALHV